MPKVYKNINVYNEAIKRYEYIFNNFDNCYFSFSGGKDSSVMVQLAMQVAKKLNKKFDILYIDLEAQYKSTIEHVEEIKELTKDVVSNFYWIALPLSLRNAVSVLQPKWTCWDKDDKEKWIRDLPQDSINEDNCPFDWFYKGMEFEEFILYFADWYNNKNKGLTATGVGIRSDESLNRFGTIVSETKTMYRNKVWTTKIKFKNSDMNVYNFYPIYDWRTEDIWTAVSKFDFKFNNIYELMYKNGVSIYEQRLCQPYGDDQRKGLDQFKALEYETWEKILNRVSGVNFGNIYAKTSLLGNLTTEKPKHMNWQQYSVFLLETLGIYAPELRDHYYRKIKTFMDWWDKEGVPISSYPDEADLKQESQKKIASWHRIARAIERNDFWMKRLSFAQTKSDVKRLYELREKYSNLVEEGETEDKKLKEFAKQLKTEEIKKKYADI
jgi:predicted phosphoadenosine phosphosulfate sulfurtransferase